MAKKEIEVKLQRSFFKTVKDILFIVVLIAIGAVVARYFLYNKQEKVSGVWQLNIKKLPFKPLIAWNFLSTFLI